MRIDEIFKQEEVVRVHIHNDKYNIGKSLAYITFKDSDAVKRICNDRDEFQHFFTYNNKMLSTDVQRKPSASLKRPRENSLDLIEVKEESIILTLEEQSRIQEERAKRLKEEFCSAISSASEKYSNELEKLFLKKN